MDIQITEAALEDAAIEVLERLDYPDMTDSWYIMGKRLPEKRNY